MLYVLDDGTVAQRLGSEVSMMTLENVQHVAVRCTCARKKGTVVDVPQVSMRLATVSPAEIPADEVRSVQARQYIAQHMFVNASGYEYILGLCTPLGRAVDGEKALDHDELQSHTLGVRFSLHGNPQHPCMYHAVNALHLLEQVFHPSLELRLS